MFTLPKATTGSTGASSVETDTTAANLAAAGLLLPNFSIPSTNFNPFLPMPMSIPQMSLTAAQLAQFGINSNQMMMPPPSYEQAMAQLMNVNPELSRLAIDTMAASLMETKDENKNLKNSNSNAIEITESDEDKVKIIFEI